MLRTIGTAALLIAAATAACGRSTPKIDVTTRDSSGVTIIDHPAGALAAVPQYRLSAPIATIGGATADMLHDATAMRNAIFLDADHFVVIDGRMNRLVLFDSAGAVQAIYGGRGTPDSLVSPGQLHVADDGSVWLVDLPARYVRLGANIQPVAQQQLGPKVPVQATVLFVHGQAAIAVENPFEQPKTADQNLHRGTSYLLRVTPDAVDTLAKWPGTEWFAVTSGEGHDQSVTTQPVRFGPTTVVRPWGHDIVVGTGDSWELEVRDTTGALRRIITLHDPVRPVTPALRDSVQAVDLREINALRGADEQTKAMARASVTSQRFADSVAPYDDAFAGRNGQLWVSETVLPTDSTRSYAIFGADGHLVGRLRVPASTRVLAADSDRVVSRSVDPTGVAFLELSRLVPAPH